MAPRVMASFFVRQNCSIMGVLAPGPRAGESFSSQVLRMVGWAV